MQEQTVAHFINLLTRFKQYSVVMANVKGDFQGSVERAEPDPPSGRRHKIYIANALET